MFKGSKFNVLSDCYFIDSLQFEVGVNRIKQIELVFNDEWIFFIEKHVREYIISFKLGKSFVFNIY
jgi:hypothetical protein